jgi:beta-lactam-binding protein with PASTA domain
MARYFEIKKNDTSKVKLDMQGRGSVQYKFKNVSPTPMDGRAVLTSLPKVSPLAGVVQNGWVKIDGPTDHHFNPNEEYPFNIKIEIPQKDRSKAGDYTFEVDAALVSIPDVITDEGPVTAFTIVAAEPSKKPNMLVWLIPVILVLVIGVGVGAWLLLGHSKKKPETAGLTVPDVTTMDPKAASAALAEVKLSVDPKIDKAPADDANKVGKVIKQDPLPGTAAVANSTVHLTVGVGKTVVPLLKDKTVQQAHDLLESHQLALGVVTNSANPSVTAGLIYIQSQEPGVEVETNTSVDVTVAPQQVNVPNVIGMTLNGNNQAISALNRVNLQVGNLACNLQTLPIVSQSPLAGTPANVGSSVNITFPCSPQIYPGQFVYYKGSAAQSALLANPRSQYVRGIEPAK